MSRKTRHKLVRVLCDCLSRRLLTRVPTARTPKPQRSGPDFHARNVQLAVTPRSQRADLSQTRVRSDIPLCAHA
jgi:hypothetical protein